MKKEFLSTIEEVTEVHFRLMEMMGTVRQYFWVGLGLLALMVLALICTLFGGTWTQKLIFASGAILLSIPLHLSFYRKELKRQVRKSLVKALGTDKPIPSEYELSPDGVIFKKQGAELKLIWSSATQIHAGGKTIEILFQPPGIVSIPKRIFNDPHEMEEWIAYIKKMAPSAPCSDS